MYAMKVISREKIGSIKLQENLDSEISIMRDYRHENIVQLYDHFVSHMSISPFPQSWTVFLFLSHSLFPRPLPGTSILSWNTVLEEIYKNILRKMRGSVNL
jgi:serine/threonine protein kinase